MRWPRKSFTSSLGALRWTGTFETKNTYQYDELGDHAFRYLILRPGMRDEPLSCTLHTSNVSEIEYEAISYVWGTEVQDRDIFCGGTIVKIKANLDETLRQVRHTDVARSLWVDSICMSGAIKARTSSARALASTVKRSLVC